MIYLKPDPGEQRTRERGPQPRTRIPSTGGGSRGLGPPRRPPPPPRRPDCPGSQDPAASTQLAESIGALVEHQRRRTRGLNLNSFVAYLIFTLLCGAGFYFLYTTRASELVDSRATARRERDAAVRRADEATAKLTAREQADQRSWEVYELLEAGEA